ncbi:MAG: PilZ domain-containing protein [Geopsychrobacter sp.]|nr:PilZ domain-containing protein [Geopsychrobacter sp.]
MTEQRHFQRIPFETVAVVTNAGHSHACDLMDLALRGALFRAPDGLPLQLGDNCALSIFLPSSDLTLDFKGELVHQEGNDYGFRFTREDDTTMGHLRRLLELNYGDARAIDQEFSHWLKD